MQLLVSGSLAWCIVIKGRPKLSIAKALRCVLLVFGLVSLFWASAAGAGLVPNLPQLAEDSGGGPQGNRQGDGWLIDLSFSTDYTSRASSVNEDSADWVTEPGYRIARNYKGPNVSFDTKIKHEWVSYHRDTFSRDRNIDGTTHLKIHPKGQRWQLSLVGVSKQALNEIDAPNTPDNQAQTHQLRVLPSYVLPLQANSRLYFSGAFVDKRFLEGSPRSDVISKNTSVTWQHNFDYEESMQLRLSNVQGDFKNADIPDYSYNEALFSLSGFVTRLKYTLSIGLNDIKRDDGSEKERGETGGLDLLYIYDGAYITGGFQKETSATSLFGTLTETATEGGSGGLSGIGGGGGFGTDPDTGIGDGSEFDSAVDFGGVDSFSDQDIVTQERIYLNWPYYHPHEYWSFGFYSVFSKQNYDTLDLDSESLELRLAASYLLPNGKALSMQINYLERDFKSPEREDFDRVRYRLFLPGYSHNRLSLHPTVGYIQRRQDGATGDYNEFTAGLDVYYTLR